MIEITQVDEAQPAAGGEQGAEQSDPAVRERTHTWSDPLRTMAGSAGLSGMEVFTAIAEGRLAPPPIMSTLGFDGFDFAEGRVAFRLTPQEFHYNPLGSVHGGVFATLLDSVCGCSVHTRLPAGVLYTSLDLNVKFLRPVTVATGPITAEGGVVHFGRRTALAEGRIVDEAGKLYATATSTCMILPVEG